MILRHPKLRHVLSTVFAFSLFFSFCSEVNASSFALAIDPSRVQPHYRDAVMLLLKKATEALPQKIKDKLDKQILVQFVPFDQSHEIETPACLSEGNLVGGLAQHHSEVYGQISGNNQIKINSLLLPEIEKGPMAAKQYPCGHGNLYNQALATIIHEVAHLYDFSDSSWLNSMGVVSSDSTYEKLAGWRRQFTLTHGLIRASLSENHLFLRSPDSYEYTDLKEHFAVNMEYFLLDPKYGCRRPAIHEYLVDHFGAFEPFEACKPNTDIFPHTYGGSLDLEHPVQLDPDRIYQVHFLLAAPSQGMGSQWGHSMFRVVVCKPGREVGPDCMKDIQYHLALSYSALVAESRLNAWSGLTGQYPSRLFVYRLKDVVENYTKLESRDIFSFPIALTHEQRVEFIYKVLEHYWEYQGKYYFFTNNCNSESVHLLRGILGGDVMSHHTPMTPVGLEEELIQLGLIDVNIRINRKAAMARGLLFPSNQKSLEDSFAVVKKEFLDANVQGTAWGWESVGDFTKFSHAKGRRQLFELLKHHFDLLEKRKADAKARKAKTWASLYFLESMIEINTIQQLRGAAYASLEKMVKESTAGSNHREVDLYKSAQKNLKGGALPMLLLKQGYGVPLKEDFREDFNENSNQTHASSGQMKPSDIDQWIKERFKEDLEEQDRIVENKKNLLNQIAGAHQ